MEIAVIVTNYWNEVYIHLHLQVLCCVMCVLCVLHAYVCVSIMHILDTCTTHAYIEHTIPLL